MTGSGKRYEQRARIRPGDLFSWGVGADKGQKGKEKLDRIDFDFLGMCCNGCLLEQVWYYNPYFPTLVWLVICLPKGHGLADASPTPR